jgi:hypothetical protein
MKILLIFITLLSSNEISNGFALSGYKLKKNHLKYYLLNTPENIDYSMTHFILRQAFKEWSDNCDLTFEFKEPTIHNNLIKQNSRMCSLDIVRASSTSRPENCNKNFVLRDNIDILVLFTDTMQAKLGIFTFENVEKSFIKNGLFGWATVPDPNISLSLIILDYDQNWVPIVQTHDYTVVNLLGVMTHEIRHVIGLLHSRDRFSIMHPMYWSWLNTVDEDDIKGCSVYYPKKKFTPICKYMSEEMCNNYLESIKKHRE